MAERLAPAIGERGLRRLGAILVAGPLALLAIAYAAIAYNAGTPLLWNVIVHEDGVRTLRDTVFFFEHATRELPLDLLLGVAIGGGVYLGLPPGESWVHAGKPKAKLWWLLAVSILVVGTIVIGAICQIGRQSFIENLLQHHTRPGAPLVWGSHWRYHLLERLASILISTGAAGALAVLTGQGRPRIGALGGRIVLGVLAVYLALTVVFTRSFGDLALVFSDPQYLGHQAREMITHLPVTAPIAWGACLLWRQGLTTLPGPAPATLGALAKPALWIAAGGTLCVYVILGAMASDATSHGQTANLITLVFPHFFEHSFTYLVAPLAAGLTYQLCWIADRRKGQDGR